MSKSLKIILIALTVTIVIAAVVFLKTWYAPHRDVKQEAGIEVSSQGILDAYSTNEKKADSLYLDKAIEVSGVVAEIAQTQTGKTIVVLKTSDPMAGVRCTMKQAVTLKAGDQATIKGICSGYLMDVTLIECYTKND